VPLAWLHVIRHILERGVPSYDGGSIYQFWNQCGSTVGGVAEILRRPSPAWRRWDSREQPATRLDRRRIRQCQPVCCPRTLRPAYSPPPSTGCRDRTDVTVSANENETPDDDQIWKRRRRDTTPRGRTASLRYEPNSNARWGVDCSRSRSRACVSPQESHHLRLLARMVVRSSCDCSSSRSVSPGGAVLASWRAHPITATLPMTSRLSTALRDGSSAGQAYGGSSLSPGSNFGLHPCCEPVDIR